MTDEYQGTPVELDELDRRVGWYIVSGQLQADMEYLRVFGGNNE